MLKGSCLNIFLRDKPDVEAGCVAEGGRGIERVRCATAEAGVVVEGCFAKPIRRSSRVARVAGVVVATEAPEATDVAEADEANEAAEVAEVAEAAGAAEVAEVA